MYSAGRLGRTAGLDLYNAGLAVDDRGLIEVDEHFLTKIKHIFSVGDVIGFPALAATSMIRAGWRLITHSTSPPTI